jgi:hypothetical protein
MSDTPLTDEAIRASDGQWTFLLRNLCRNLERELEQKRQDCKQAELDVCRALGERNDARAELARLKATIADPDEVELAMIRGEIAIPHRVGFDYICGNT